jgi:Flp pilus assembly pilin Flp
LRNNLIQDEDGSVAIEFSMLALPFFLTVLTILFVAYHSLVQSELDRATAAIAREIAVQANDAPTSADYLSQGTCAKHLGALINCAKLKLGATTVPGRLFTFRQQPIGGKMWSLGCANDTVLIELNYPVASFISPIVIADVVTMDGVEYYRSRAVIRREPVVTGSGSC